MLEQTTVVRCLDSTFTPQAEVKRVVLSNSGIEETLGGTSYCLLLEALTSISREIRVWPST